MNSINLNSPEYNLKCLPTPDKILEHINDLSIFNRYIKNLEVNTAFSSPLRKDENPSFSVFYSKKLNKFLFKDLSSGESGDCFIFLRKLFPQYNFNEILNMVCWEFGLDDYFPCDYLKGKNQRPAKVIENLDDYKKPNKILQIKIKRGIENNILWESHDIDFWMSFGVTLKTLNIYNVFPVTHIFIYDPLTNKTEILATDRYAYAFVENKDNKVTYKIYQPYSTMKWLSSHNYTVHQGYMQLPDKGPLLIITKSLKDVMSLRDVADIPAIAIQSENIIIKDTVIQEYKERFTFVFTLFDNDQTGINLSQKYKEIYDINYLIIPPESKRIKDFSDLVKETTKIVASRFIKNLIKTQILNE